MISEASDCGFGVSISFTLGVITGEIAGITGDRSATVGVTTIVAVRVAFSDEPQLAMNKTNTTKNQDLISPPPKLRLVVYGFCRPTFPVTRWPGLARYL